MGSNPTEPDLNSPYVLLPRRILTQLSNLNAAALRAYIAIAAHAPATTQVVAEATGANVNAVRQAIRALHALGLIVKEGKRWRPAGDGQALEQESLLFVPPDPPPVRPARTAKLHPAIAAYTQIYRFQPSRADAAAIVAAVGENSGMEIWRKTLQLWREKKYNPRNVAGMLDVFRRMRSAMPAAEVGEHNAGEIMNRQLQINGLAESSD
jgi:hypothetical protein